MSKTVLTDPQPDLKNRLNFAHTMNFCFQTRKPDDFLARIQLLIL